MARIKGFFSKTLQPIPHQKRLVFNCYLTFWQKIFFAHPVLNIQQNVSENDDNDDDYKFFWNKKTGRI